MCLARHRSALRRRYCLLALLRPVTWPLAATVYADALVLPVLHILGCMAVLQFVKFNVDM